MIKKYLEKLRTARNQKMEIPQEYPFVMFEEEKELLKKHLLQTKNYLEFGTGGSILFALINSEVNITSVDTNIGWINFIKKYRIIRNNLEKRLKIFFVDIGPTKHWGYPVDDREQAKFPDFSSKIFQLSDPSKYDLILVDGRFRVACTLSSILHCHQNKNLTLMIHDYSIREDYKIVEKFLEKTDEAKTLFVFKIKENTNLAEVQELYEQDKYVTD